MPSEEELTVIARLKDDMSSGLARIGTQVDALTKKIDAQQTRVRSHTKALGSNAKTLEGHSRTLDRASRTLTTGGSLLGSGRLAAGIGKTGGALDQLSKTKAVGVLASLGSAADTFGKKIDLTDKLGSLSNGLRTVAEDALKLTTGIGAAGIAIAAFSLKTAAGMQQTTLGLSTQLGSAAAGAAMMKQIQRLSNTSVFSTSTLGSAASTMMSQGLPGGQVPKMLASLTSVASSQVDPSESLSSLIDTVSQAQHTGLLSSDALDSLSNAGVPARDLASQVYGVPKLMLNQYMGIGNVQSGPLLAALENQTGLMTKYRGGNQRATGTLSGEFDVMKNQLENQLGNAASPLAGSLSKDMPGFTKGLTSLTNTVGPAVMNMTGQVVQSLGSTLPGAMAKLTPEIPKITKAFAQLVSAGVSLFPELIKVAAAVLPIVPVMVKLATDVLPVVVGFANLVMKIAPLKDLIGGLLLAFAGFSVFTKLAKIVKAAMLATETLTTKLGLLRDSEAATATTSEVSGAETAAGRLGGVAPIMSSGERAASKAGMLTRGVGGLAVGLAGTLGLTEGSHIALTAYGSKKQTLMQGVDMVGGSALAGAGVGATIGSIIPGAGTLAGGLIGGGVGALAGTGLDVAKNGGRWWDDIFGGGHHGTMSATPSRAAQVIAGGNVTIGAGAIQINGTNLTPAELSTAISSGVNNYMRSRQQRNSQSLTSSQPYPTLQRSRTP